MKYLLSYKLFENQESKTILDFPSTRQSNLDSCGISAVQSIGIYYGIDHPEDYFDNEDKEHNYFSKEDILNFFKKHKFKTEVKEDMSIDDLKKYIDKKIPVIVFIQAWSKKKVDYTKTNKEGHDLVVIGYDEKNLYFNDPSIGGNLGMMTQSEFMKRWHDQEEGKEMNQLGIAVYGTPKYDSKKIQKIK